MVIKIAGSILVFVCSAVLGFYFANKDSFRIKDLSQMKKALAILKSEIEFAKNPLPEAMENIAGRVSEPVANIFTACAESLKHKTHGANEAWEHALRQISLKCYFTSADIGYLSGLGKTLGYLDKNLQAGSIDILIDYIDTEVQLLNEQREKNKKMYQSLGILGGLLVIIVLL